MSMNLENSSENQTSIREWKFEEALTHIGIGKIHLFIIINSGLLIGASITETMNMTFIMKSAECDLELSSADKGVLSSVAYLGVMLTSVIWGLLSDMRGRRNLMKWTALLTTIFSILSSFSPNYTVLLVMRFLVGVFLASSVGSVYPYLGEFIPIKYRQTIMSVASFSIGLSLIYVPGVAWLLLPLDFRFSIFGLFEFRPWRALILCCALPGLISTLGLFFLPESPKYFMGQGMEIEALQVLAWIYSKNSGQPQANLSIKKLQSESNESSNPSKRKNFTDAFISQVLPIFKPPHIGHLILCTVITGAILCVSNSVGLWFSEIENEVSISNVTGSMCEILSKKSSYSNMTNEENGHCDDTISIEVYKNSIVLGLYYVIGYILIASLMQFIGRGYISAFCLFGSGLSGLALLWITRPIITLFLFTSFITLSGIMVSVVTGAAVLLFPTNYRAMAVCIILTLGRLGTILGTNFLGAFLYVNCEVTIGVITGYVLLAACLNFLLPFK